MSFRGYMQAAACEYTLSAGDNSVVPRLFPANAKRLAYGDDYFHEAPMIKIPTRRSPLDYTSRSALEITLQMEEPMVGAAPARALLN